MLCSSEAPGDSRMRDTRVLTDEILPRQTARPDRPCSIRAFSVTRSSERLVAYMHMHARTLRDHHVDRGWSGQHRFRARTAFGWNDAERDTNQYEYDDAKGKV